ncbi:MAG: hypothetical protein V7607_2535 [Solirubrobacteraceae bacterium]
MDTIELGSEMGMNSVMRPARVRLAMLLTALVATFFATAATASAAGTASNIRSLLVAFPALQGDSACTKRTIYLAAGRYHWEDGDYVQDEGWYWPMKQRDITLVAGNYDWTDCIRWDVGIPIGNLLHVSSLHTANHPTAYLPTYYFQPDYHTNLGIYYECSFGSKLTPL